MSDWIIPAAVTVQCISTVVLVVLTGRYARSVKRQVDQDRDFFNRKAAQSAALVERQARESEARERQQIQRAIRTIVAELELNASETKWRFPDSPPLLNAAFAANLWVLPSADLKPETFKAVGDAYLNIHRYDLLYVAATTAQRHEVYRSNAAQVAWQDAQKAIGQALEAIRTDPATSDLPSGLTGAACPPTGTDSSPPREGSDS